jgi:hypothetical protein
MLDRLLHDPALKQRAAEISRRFDPAGWIEHNCREIEALDPTRR